MVLGPKFGLGLVSRVWSWSQPQSRECRLGLGRVLEGSVLFNFIHTHTHPFNGPFRDYLGEPVPER